MTQKQPFFFFLLLLLALLAGCEAAEAPRPTPIYGGSALATIRPTPTLAAGVQPAQPAVTPATATPNPVNEILGQPTVVAVVPNSSPNTSQPTQPAVPDQPLLPTPTVSQLPPAEHLALAQRFLQVGNSQLAQAHLSALLAHPERTAGQESEAWFQLGLAEKQNGNIEGSVRAFRQHLNQPNLNPYAHFYLAEMNQAAGNCSVAITEYNIFLEANPDLGAYIYPRLARCYTNPEEIILAYREAIDSSAYYVVVVNLRRELANVYREQGNIPAAIAQYEAIREVAQTENTKGEMTYLIGSMYLAAGDTAKAYEAYQFGVVNYPQAYESYLALVALVEAKQPVDEFQRGLIDYFAKAYAPGIEAFNRYLQANPSGYRPDVHLYLAWSYEKVADFDNALAQLELYLATNPADPTTIGRYAFEKAELQARSISVAEAITTLQNFVATYPEHERRAEAMWDVALYTDRWLQDGVNASARYLEFTTAYPNHEHTAEGFFRAGMLAWEQGYTENAVSAWQQAAAYDDEMGHAALVWLITVLPAEESAPYRAQAAAVGGVDYYTIRASELGQGVAPYARLEKLDFTFDEEAGKQEVENWLRVHFNLDEAAVVQSDLAPGLVNDTRLVRGSKLWNMGLYAEARLELDAVRQEYANNAQLSYQLALYFRDLGAYRSSIIAAASVLYRAGVTVYQAPPLIGRLIYPVYYADIILPLAEQYNFDPLLQFSLIRQESLFESTAASSAAAQGLMQIIPDTGTFIAQKLGWPNYQNQDLYRPYLSLTFGAYYLNLQLELFDGQVAPALSAYNAGPGNALKWHDRAGDNHDRYLETVNFSETRLYIRTIYVNHAAYRFLYGAAE